MANGNDPMLEAIADIIRSLTVQQFNPNTMGPDHPLHPSNQNSEAFNRWVEKQARQFMQSASEETSNFIAGLQALHRDFGGTLRDLGFGNGGLGSQGGFQPTAPPPPPPPEEPRPVPKTEPQPIPEVQFQNQAGGAPGRLSTRSTPKPIPIPKIGPIRREDEFTKNVAGRFG